MSSTETTTAEKVFTASQWTLIWWKFRKHRLAMISLAGLVILYLAVLFADFISPYNPRAFYREYIFAPPTTIRIIHDGRLSAPFVYNVTSRLNPETYLREYIPDTSLPYRIRFLHRGAPYSFLGLFESDLRLFGTDGAPLFLFGTDGLGRDIFSRILHGGRISLTIGLVGIALAFILGLLLGGIAGYMGGVADEVIMRIIDMLVSIPTLPLWMALSAAIPRTWPMVRTYFAITVVLAVVGWAGLARVVRGKFISLKGEDFITAARVIGCSRQRIIFMHLLPSFMSFIIVQLTLSIPAMILGETALSFLGLGMQAPAFSWGVLLQQAQDLNAMVNYPWVLIPCIFVILSILMFNFCGDGLRDASDPYSG
jgi:peptide/nickel transport system permease protein